jgi:two-component system, OmpR family, response regulator
MRILVVEDDPKIASFVTKGLQEAGYTVDQATTGDEGIALAMSTPYSAAVVDLMLPELDGLSVIKRLRANNVGIPAIVLSAKHAVADRVECLEEGADDYVAKPFAFSELLARLHAVLRRSKASSEPTTLEIGDLRMDLLNRRVERAGRVVELQPREFALLEHLMRNAGRALSKSYLLEQLWDYSFDPQTNVVDVLLCRLRNKIDRDFDRKLIHTLRGVGYVLRPA